MYSKDTMNSFVTLAMAALLAGILVLGASTAQAQTESLLYSFQGYPDGASPSTPLTSDAKGNLYGTTYGGGTNGCGTVFKLTPAGVETVLYSFTCTDGANPMAGVVLDKAGNIYGTTGYGGIGYGVVYQLTPSGVETPLYIFQGGFDGGLAFTGVVLDKAGNLYGTTYEGGANGYGTVYMVTPTGIETVLYSFAGGIDGCGPDGGSLMFGPKKALYGTTTNCGAYGEGTVYKVTLSGQETILHNFANDGIDGTHPYAGVVRDKGGNLYGTTYQGGSNNVGTVYQLTSTGMETIVHNFASDGTDGYYPDGQGVILDKLGNLFGTASHGGASGFGIVYELTSSGTETVLYAFQGYPYDGGNPYASVLLGRKNSLYGTTGYGGTSNHGAVFKVTY